MNIKNKSVYNLISFYITGGYLIRKTNIIKKIGFKVKKIEHSNNYTIQTEVMIKYRESDESIFSFISTFKINDLFWAEELGEKQLNSILFSVTFPYVRAKIGNLLSESSEPLIIPVLDLRSIDISEWIVLERKK